MIRGFPDLPPIWAAAAAVLAWGLAQVFPQAHLPAAPGWVLMAAGLALILWAASWFRARRTTIEPHRTPTTLIVEGPFRINRNPIYTGMTLILVGWAFVLGAAAALLPALLFPGLVTRRFILGEETALRSAFGSEAERYLSATRRW